MPMLRSQTQGHILAQIEPIDRVPFAHSVLPRHVKHDPPQSFPGPGEGDVNGQLCEYARGNG